VAEEELNTAAILRLMLTKAGGDGDASRDRPPGYVAAQVLDVLLGGDGDLPDVMALHPLGATLAEMTRVFGGEPTTLEAQQAAAELLRVLRGEEGGPPDERPLRAILRDVLEAMPSRTRAAPA
jgi:hypothetical protein